MNNKVCAFFGHREIKGQENLRERLLVLVEEFTYLPLDYNYWYTRIYYRNCEMIDRSDCVIFYAEQKKESGAYKALRYAQKKKKPHINLFYETPTV